MTTDVEPHFYKDAKADWHQARRRRAILALFEGLNGRVLDYGCGWGDLAYHISKLPGIDEVVGVDVDEQRVDFAKREYHPLQFDVCKADQLEYPDESFDIVCSSVVVHFVPSPDTYLTEIFRLLKPGGHAVIMTRGEERVRNALRGLFGRAPVSFDSQLYCPTAAEFETALSKAGLEIERRNFFHDPPFDNWTSLKSIAIGSVEQLGSLFRIRSTAQYLGYLVSKRSLASAE